MTGYFIKALAKMRSIDLKNSSEKIGFMTRRLQQVALA